VRFKEGDIVTLLRQKHAWEPYKTIYEIVGVRHERYQLKFIKSQAWPEREGTIVLSDFSGSFYGDFDDDWGLHPKYVIKDLLTRYYGSDTSKL
jgi:hypothetical protein